MPAEPLVLVRVGSLPPGAIIHLADGTPGVVLGQRGCSRTSDVGVDLWHEPAALLPRDELVELVEAAEMGHLEPASDQP